MAGLVLRLSLGRSGVVWMKIKDLIDDAESLPVEERALVVDSLLRSLNPPESEIDERWAAVARQRLEAVREGTVEAIPGEQVFAKIWKRYEG
jgi:putative addiction module component (TIGR02574 family)